MTKYKEYVQKMLDVNKEGFDSFRKIHDNYALNKVAYQEEFNREGEKILPLIHEWENKLCMQSEKAGYGGYTAGLAEKFQAEVKKEFPLIDHIGIIVKKFSMTSPTKLSLWRSRLNGDDISAFNSSPDSKPGVSLNAAIKKISL